MQDRNFDQLSSTDMLHMAADIVSAYVSNNVLPSSQLPEVISSVYGTLRSICCSTMEQPAENKKPAVSIRRSVTDDYIVCLEDGKKLKMLKRHLKAVYNMTPDDYRAKWNLPSDYPMVAPNYAKRRSEFAKQIGLGSQGVTKIRRKAS